ncbi:MAG: hypothetical protein ACXWP5_01350 [Bdellovibrionota bacterium]
MALMNRLLQKAFPVMAITGLLMAGWGLIITPDEIKANAGNDGITAMAWGGKAVAQNSIYTDSGGPVSE